MRRAQQRHDDLRPNWELILVLAICFWGWWEGVKYLMLAYHHFIGR